MPIDSEQRKKNTDSKNEYIAGKGNQHGEMGKKPKIPQSGAVGRATYESSYDMGRSTRRDDPEYANKNWENIKHKPKSPKEHELPHWG